MNLFSCKCNLIIYVLVFFTSNLFSMSTAEIESIIKEEDKKLPTEKCFQMNDFESCKNEFNKQKYTFTNGYTLVNEKIKSTGNLEFLEKMSKTENEQFMLETIEVCMNQYSNFSANELVPSPCLNVLDKYKQKNRYNGYLFDYLMNLNLYNMYDEKRNKLLKDAIVKYSEINIMQKHTDNYPNLPTWIMRNYIKTDSFLIRKVISDNTYSVIEFPLELNDNNEYSHKAKVFYSTQLNQLTRNFQEYINLINNFTNVDKIRIYELMRLLLPDTVICSMKDFRDSNYYKAYIPLIDGMYSVSLTNSGENYSLLITVPQLVKKGYNWDYNFKNNQRITINSIGDCNKIGSDTSIENVGVFEMMRKVKNQNVFYDIYKCEVPKNERELVLSLLGNIKKDKLFWEYKIKTSNSYNYYTENEWKIISQNNKSNSSSSSTSTTSSTSSSNSSTKGMKSIRSQGKYGEYPSWSIECNSGYSRTLYLDKNNHWHANGSSSDMGSKYDSWSKEQVADYICNEL